MYSRWSIGKDDDNDAVFKAALGRVGYQTQDSVESQGGTVEGLMYACSEDDEHEETILQRTAFETGKPSPIPFTTSPQSSPSNAFLSPTVSLISPSFIGTNERERRPSLAPSADLAGSWEGASDIYDDYRYSRFSMAGKMSMSSRFSVNAASGAAPTPPPESRPSTDSSGHSLVTQFFIPTGHATSLSPVHYNLTNSLLSSLFSRLISLLIS